MYQASFACGAKEVRNFVSSYTSAFEPGGARGVLLKLNSPSKMAYAESFGLRLDAPSKLSVILHFCSSLHQNCIGKFCGRYIILRQGDF